MDPVIPLDLHVRGPRAPSLLYRDRGHGHPDFAVLALRYVGKRGVGQLTPFELVVIIALGSATGDSMFYPDVPILYAWLVIASMVARERLVANLQARSRRVNAFMEGLPRLLVHDGRILEEELAAERMRVDELLSRLREKNILNTGEIRYASLEPSGPPP